MNEDWSDEWLDEVVTGNRLVLFMQGTGASISLLPLWKRTARGCAGTIS